MFLIRARVGRTDSGPVPDFLIFGPGTGKRTPTAPEAEVEVIFGISSHCSGVAGADRLNPVRLGRPRGIGSGQPGPVMNENRQQFLNAA